MPSHIFQGDLGEKEEKEHGENTWLHWNRKNWGTKWGAYGQKLEVQGDWKVIIRFETAWSWPEPIINKLIDLNPDLSIEFLSADDGGWFALRLSKDSEGKITKDEWTTEAKNDEGGVIRGALFEALNPKY